MKNFKYLIRKEGEKQLHISHLLQYISAYEVNDWYIKDIEREIKLAYQLARETTDCQYVNYDGECMLQITPMGYVILLLPWKKYKIFEEEKNATT